MRKHTSLWALSKLMERINQIDFPQYQREPTIWTKAAKQRLIDSILRDFDISAIYLYRHDDGHWDCVDGRQRISAIRSFLGENPDDKGDNGFPYKIMNEIFEDADHPYEPLNGQNYAHIIEQAGLSEPQAEAFRKALQSYPITVVELSESAVPEEFNLQFTRLNLGQLIISGEKLHAMVGELRDLCFDKLGQHKFLSGIQIPTRRYAREQLAAQIVAQVFALETSKRDDGERAFARMRHNIDLQRLFKLHAEIGSKECQWLARVERVMDLLGGQLSSLPALKSRSIVLSLVLLAYERNVDDEENAREFARFSSSFVGRLKWQVSLGFDVNDEYRYLIDFRRHLTQASVEKYSVRERAAELERSFDYWREHGHLVGDQEYQEKHNGLLPEGG